MPLQPGALAPLPERQPDVVRLVAQGLTNGEIAEKLTLAEGTVANHVRDSMQRLGLRNRVELAVWAVRHDDPRGP